MTRILILADDLSGAADCGIACTNAGLSTAVVLGELSEEIVADVVSIDADTRRLDALSAATRMEHLVNKYAENSSTLLFKKIDSTLRGHLGPELFAVLKARRTGKKRAFAIMAPAFPAIGRTTVRGLHLVHGNPLHQTETWRHQHMNGEAYIPQMLEKAGLTTAQFDTVIIRGGRSDLHHMLARASETADVLVCDAETEEDLFSIAEATIALGPEALWVGSAGLAHHLPHAAGLASCRVRELEVPPIRGPVLFAIGSISNTSKQQVRVLAGSSNLHCITVPTDVLLAGDTCIAWQQFGSELFEAIDDGQDVVLAPCSESEIELSYRSQLSLALARMTEPLRGRIGALVSSGGETARMILERWGVTALRLLGQLERGVPISAIENTGFHPTIVITKAGDFGTPETLLHCREWLTRGTDL